MEHPSIPHETCMPCYEGASSHEDWHPTRGELLKLGKELTARVRAREDRTVAQMPDPELVAYGQRMRRLLATATDEWWPDEATALVAEWVHGAEKEWRWRQRAARLGADPVQRSAGTWTERVERIKRQVDLLPLIGAETGGVRMHGSTKATCRCPFHDDQSPSLDIDMTKGVWLCRACQIGGDAIRYAELRHGYAFADAVSYLEERCGLRPPEPVRSIRGISNDT
jgi:hypothetical protein